MKSIWQNTVEKPLFPTLNEDIKTDVLIIGGGIAGILCAFELQKKNVNYTLVEADKICNGITADTTAKITFSHGLVYDKMIKSQGIEKAKLYLEAQEKAIEFFRNFSHDIDCDFEIKDNYIYSLNDIEKIEKEIIALQKLGVKAHFKKELPLPFGVSGAVKTKNQGQFNPLKFLYSIAKGLNIYENTKVTELKNKTAITNKCKITAEKIIVATHFPFINKHGSYFAKMYQHRSYVIAYKEAPDINGMYVDENKTGMSFRNYGDILLLGGGGHKTGKQGGNWQEISAFAKRHYGKIEEICRYATQDCITLDSIAYIGNYSKTTPDLYVATGFNKWGMTNAYVSAMILSDLVTDKENIYAKVFSPSRSILKPQLAINIAESAIGLLTPTKPRCPHLGCALKYNKTEHSWDCPCHGSRFTEDGKLINNPATDDKKLDI